MKLTEEQQNRLIFLLENDNEHNLLATLLQQPAPKPKPKPKPKTVTRKPQKKLSKAEKEAFAIFWFSLIAFCALYFYFKMWK